MHDLLQQADDLLDVGNLLIGDEDQRIVQLRDHLLVVGDHIGARVAAVELHAFHQRHFGLQGLGFFDGDDAVLADLIHRVRDQIADDRIAGGNRGDLRDALLALDGLAQLGQRGDGRIRGLLNALAQFHGIRARGHILHAFADDRLRQQGSGGGAVARDVVRLGGDFLHELRAHVLKGIFQLNFLGDGHAVVGDQRSAKLLIEHNVAALGAQGNFNGIRQLIDAFFQRAAGFLTIQKLLCHCDLPPYSTTARMSDWRTRMYSSPSSLTSVPAYLE